MLGLGPSVLASGARAGTSPGGGGGMLIHEEFFFPLFFRELQTEKVKTMALS